MKTRGESDWYFFLLAFFLLGGMALKAAALYWCGIIFPAIFFRKKLRQSSFPFLSMGIALACAHSLFILGNLIQIPLQGYSWHGIVIKEFIAGEFSSALLICAFFMMGLAYLRSRGKALAPDAKMAAEPTPPFVRKRLSPTQHFCYGMLVGSAILLVYCLVQCTTGFDFNALNAYRVDRLLPNGFYRVSGFSSHPVPFGGLTLGIMSFFAYLTAEPPYAERRFRLITGLICFMQLILVMLSGSRGGAVVAMIMLAFIFGYHVKISLKQKVLLLSLGITCCLLLIGASGMIYRFQESLGNSAVSGFGERATFWKVHWAIFTQHPWLGEGIYWLKNGGREAAYNAMGLAGFDKKFNAHNIFLELLAQIGCIGFVILTSCLVVCGKLLKKQFAGGITALWYRALRAAFVAELLLGLTENTLGDATIFVTLLGFLWIIIWEDVILREAHVTATVSV